MTSFESAWFIYGALLLLLATSFVVRIDYVRIGLAAAALVAVPLVLIREPDLGYGTLVLAILVVNLGILARLWLRQQQVRFSVEEEALRREHFGLDATRLHGWIDALGWEKLLNKAGTTFRKLPDDAKTGLDSAMAKALMLEQPAMIRRPVVEAADGISVGFSAADWQARFAA